MSFNLNFRKNISKTENIRVIGNYRWQTINKSWPYFGPWQLRYRILWGHKFLVDRFVADKSNFGSYWNWKSDPPNCDNIKGGPGLAILFYINFVKQERKLENTNIVGTYCWECALKRARRRPWPNHRQMIHVVRAWIEQLFPRNDTQPIKMSGKILSLQIGDIR